VQTMLLRLAALVAAVNPALADEVTSLPGLVGGLTSRMYSGYLEATQGHFLFYVFVESLSSPESDPLMVWTNGGPGCSSMMGFLTENGPYATTMTPGELVSNPYAWNTAANYLYVEHPIGVGFSYSTNKVDYQKLGDDTDASDFYAALRDFYVKFPSYVGRDLLLTGESYAGEYVPHLAHKIAFGADATLAASLRGIALGNPVFNCDSYVNDGPWAIFTLNMLYYTGLIPYEGPYAEFVENDCGQHNEMPASCFTAFNAAYELPGTWSQGIADSDPDGVNATRTFSGSRRVRLKRMRNERMRRLRARFGVPEPRPERSASRRPARPDSSLQPDSDTAPSAVAGERRAEAARVGKLDAVDDMEPDYDPDHKYGSFCTGNGTLEFATLPNAMGEGCHSLGGNGQEYLNRADVQEALHVTQMPAAGYWSECTDGDWWQYEQPWPPVNVLTAYYEPLFAELPASQFRVLIYSGVEDIGVVTLAETQQCLAELGASSRGKATAAWAPWRMNGSPLGYWQAWERLTYATVKGAGHMAPTNQPASTFEMLYRWWGSNNLTNASFGLARMS